MKNISICLLGCVSVLASLTNVAAETVTIDAGIAQMIKSGVTDEAFAEDGRMIVGYHSSEFWQNVRGTIEFDLSAIPSGSTITGVTFSFHKNAGSVGYTGDVEDLELRYQGVPVSSLNGAEHYRNFTQIDWGKIDGGDTTGTLLGTFSKANRDAFALGGYQAFETTAEFIGKLQESLDRDAIFSVLMWSPLLEQNAISTRIWRIGTAEEGEAPRLEVEYTAPTLSELEQLVRPVFPMAEEDTPGHLAGSWIGGFSTSTGDFPLVEHDNFGYIFFQTGGANDLYGFFYAVNPEDCSDVLGWCYMNPAIPAYFYSYGLSSWGYVLPGELTVDSLWIYDYAAAVWRKYSTSCE